MDMGNLRIPVLLRALVLLALVAGLALAVLLIAGGSMDYWNAWACVAEFYVLEGALAVYLHRRNPGLLAKRMDAREKHGNQRIFTTIAYAVIALSVLALPGIDRRLGWSMMPWWIPALALVAMAIAFVFEFITVRQNDYLFRVIDVAEGQKVVDTGIYAVIRHPMYLFGMLIVLSMPLALGSLYGFIAASVFLAPLFVLRIRNEEKVLARELPGYREYMAKVRYRLIPFLY
jgi:protein-S-isoprenylcysteine O-methyltransferase Ste14